MALSPERLKLIQDLAAEQAAGEAEPDFLEKPVPEDESFLDSLNRRIVEPVRESIVGKGLSEEAEKLGYSLRGAPAYIRRAEGFSSHPISKLTNLSENLKKEYGQEVELFYSPTLKRVGFVDPNSGEKVIANPPGMDAGDWHDFVGSSFGLPFEAAGVLAGRRFGQGWRSLKALVGGMTGAYTGEKFRLDAEDTMGLLKGLSEEQIKQLYEEQPKLAAQLSGAGEVAGRGLMKIVKGAKNILTNKSIPESYVKTGLDLKGKTAPEAEALNDLIREGGGTKEFKPSTGQMLDDSDVLAAEEWAKRSRGTPGTEAFKQQHKGQVEALEEALKASERNVPNTLADTVPEHEVPSVAGRKVQADLDTQGRRAESTMQSRVETARGTHDEAVGELDRRSLHRGTEPDVGSSVREPALQKYDELKRWADIEYSGLEQEVGGFKFPMNNLKSAVADEWQQLSSDLAPSLTEENKLLINGLRTKFEELTSKHSWADYDQVTRFLRQVSKAKRQLSKGDLVSVEEASLNRLHRAAIKDVVFRLKEFKTEDPKLFQRWLDIRQEYRNKKSELTQGIVGKMLKRGPKGDYAIADEKLFYSLYGPDKSKRAASVTFADHLNDPKSFQAKIDFEAAVWSDIKDKILKPSDGTIDPIRLENYVKNHQGVLRDYFGDDILNTLKDKHTAAKGLIDMQARQKSFESAMKKAVGAEFRTMHSDDIVRHIWASPKNVKKAQKALKRFPEAWDGVQESLKDAVRGDITDADPYLEGMRSVSHEKLDRLLSAKGVVEKDWRRKISYVFGEQYLNDLRTIRNAARLATRKAGPQEPVDFRAMRPGGTTKKLGGLLLDAYFGPLNHKRFALRKIGAAKSSQQAATLMEIISDPEKLHTVAKSVHTPDGMKDLQMIVGGTVSKHQKESDTEDLIMENMEKIRQSPAFNRLKRDIQLNPDILKMLREGA